MEKPIFTFDHSQSQMPEALGISTEEWDELKESTLSFLEELGKKPRKDSEVFECITALSYKELIFLSAQALLKVKIIEQKFAMRLLGDAMKELLKSKL